MTRPPNTPAPGKPLLAMLDDDAQLCRLFENMLSDRFDVRSFSDVAGFNQWLEGSEPDLMVLDLNLGTRNPYGFDVAMSLRERGFTFPIVVLTVGQGMDVTGRAFQLGLPFLQKDKDLDPAKLNTWFRAVLESASLRSRVDFYGRQLGMDSGLLPCPWNESTAGKRIRESFRPFAESRLPLLIHGEEGTGKKIAARWVVQESLGADAQLLPVVARGVQERDLETLVFGRVTGGSGSIRGALCIDGTGAMYLDGFEALSEGFRERLRLAISTGSYVPPGGTAAWRVRSRLILGARVGRHEEGTFLSSLDSFWIPFTLRLPPLRDRREDIPFHLRYLAEELSSQGGQASAVPTGLESALATQPLHRNYYDLKLALIRGSVEPDSVEHDQAADWESLARRDWRYVEDLVLKRYLAYVGRKIDRDVDAWMEHTGYGRSTIFKWFSRMDEENLWPPGKS